MAINRTFAERCEESTIAPQPLPIPDSRCSIGGNSPTEVYGIIENTPGNTPLNTAKGRLMSMPGVASKTGQPENPYAWINSASLAPYVDGPTGTDR